MVQNPGAPTPTPRGPDNREYLRTFLKPEYIQPDGGVRFPGPGEGTYDGYQRWCNDNDNSLSKRAQTMTKDARAAMRHCMTDIGWIDAA